ncbi:hypothetical protein C3K47_18950 [Solitalea longa]|uniref:DUF4595 domain-containing protein n=1 Tax=Solitalea longa TaxID=2079460 RepID=A0A2S4ZXV5_9SPHI|nr:hypothetical protein [Solitalea longa]POY34713.1 hypothetical protein C3K47_18950 [Solitalea longa]
MKNLFWIFIVCAVIFVSCKKDQVPELSHHNKLYKEFYHRAADQVRIFYYNSDNTLKKYEYQFDQGISERHEYFYKNKQLTQIENYSWNGLVKDLILTQIFKLNYIGNGQIEIEQIMGDLAHGSVHGSSTTMYGRKLVLYFDVNGNLVSCNVFSDSMEIITKYKFEHDSKGNIISEEKKDFFNDQIETFYKEYKYDNNINPKYKLEDIFDFSNYYSPNNCIEEIEKNEAGEILSTINRVLEINNDYLPINFTAYSNYKYSGSSQIRREYVYY